MKRKRKRHVARVKADAPRLRSGQAAKLWAEIEDYFVPNLRVWLAERVVYFHLVRKSRLAGKRVILTSLGQLSRDLCMSKNPIRTSLWRLAKKGALRILSHGYEGYRVRVRVPREIPGCVRKGRTGDPRFDNCIRPGIGRLAIFEREGHRCFYCLRQLETRGRALDHVRPRARGGRHSYRNVVACCTACNSLKGHSDAGDFLRLLHRRHLISRREFYRRMAALEALKQGRLRPQLPKAA